GRARGDRSFGRSSHRPRGGPLPGFPPCSYRGAGRLPGLRPGMDALRGDRVVSRKIRKVALLGTAALLVGSTSNAAALDLSLRDAVARALTDGTTARIAVEQVNGAAASAAIERSAMLPTLETTISGGDQNLNLKTFGFAPPGGPSLVGPFTVV